ncbi:hypothetical protein GCM10025768_27980 [Microbacterium pseudoresistens]|uniref:Heavy metal-binding domain-containing protein n=1 Tax=Microbacterium pseudoresistens TaxID=640634 RepID=A0A7Y9ETL3_9MICO|nr:hypothetical protein [Microbacterium pseudoresistens]NYD53688.1 hypothetical protein [Microbacterium pseudoresistens]
MRAGARLALYGGGLAVAFAAAFAASAAIIPSDAVAAWGGQAEMGAHDGHGEESEAVSAGQALKGLSLEAQGYALSPIDGPPAVGVEGVLSFQIQTVSGEPVMEYAVAHEKELHLIVVRSDGAEFRHVHPVRDEVTGTWSVPWTWNAAGTYRVYADFTPATDGAEGITLTRAIDIGGSFAPVSTEARRVAEVDGFTVTLDGDLVAGGSGELTVSVERAGEPVTSLEPYLGAFGHLVALREGDLAYLHVHAMGDDPTPGDTAGPEVAFMAEAPTAGRYLLYFDFQVDGQVHTAEFVIDAGHGDGAPSDHGDGH